MNINDKVEFTLTAHGARIWNTPHRAAAGVASVLAGDTLREPLWVVMSEFGDHCTRPFAVNNELTLLERSAEREGAPRVTAAKMEAPRVESPEVAAGVSKRMNAVITLGLKVEAGTLSPATARLALAAGGYGLDVIEGINALEVKPTPERTPEEEADYQLGGVVVNRLYGARCPGETIVDVLDRLMAGADDGAEVVS